MKEEIGPNPVTLSEELSPSTLGLQSVLVEVEGWREAV